MKQLLMQSCNTKCERFVENENHFFNAKDNNTKYVAGARKIYRARKKKNVERERRRHARVKLSHVSLARPIFFMHLLRRVQNMMTLVLNHKQGTLDTQALMR